MPQDYGMGNVSRLLLLVNTLDRLGVVKKRENESRATHRVAPTYLSFLSLPSCGG
jgi:hypothetical protein